MLEIRALTKRFRGFTAVRDVSFCVRPGEILGYLGPNGAGKSTTVKTLIGLLDPSEGQVLWNGRSVIDDLSAFHLFAFFAAALTALWLWVRSERHQGWGEAKVIYDDDPEVLANLGLKG
jgi:ABC-type uncharacterized transport system ATPase subunit